MAKDKRFSPKKLNQRYQHDQYLQQQADEACDFYLEQGLSIADLDPGHTVEYQASTTYKALRRLAYYYNLQVPSYKQPPQTVFHSQQEAVTYQAKRMNLRLAQIKLEGLWWRQASTPLLVFDDTGEMGVLYPKLNNTFEWVDPDTGARQNLTATKAQSLYQQAFTIIPQAQSDGPLSFKRLWSAIFLQNKVNIGWLLGLFFLLSLLGLITPVVTGVITKHAIANADYQLLGSLIALLMGVATSIGLFMLVRTIVLVRFETRANYNLQNMIIDRVLRLPFPFFTPYQSGDLANRMLSIDSLIKNLTGANIDATLTFAFSSVSFVLMFYYAPALSIITLVILVLVLIALYYLTRKQAVLMTQAMNRTGRTLGFLFQTLNGISRIKTFAKEHVLEAEWAKRYSQSRRSMYHGYILGAWRSTIIQTSKIVTLILLFLAIAYLYNQAMSLQSFITFFSAYSQFMAGFLVFANTIPSLVSAYASTQRLKPILNATPESSQNIPMGSNFEGAIKAQHVTFRYEANSQPVIDDLCLDIPAGDFAALVGLSGSGKSTLIRLLLGFYQPESGHILFDGDNINQLNQYHLRQQIGVVLQDGQMLGSTLLEHIIGDAPLTEDDAWQAAKSLGLADRIQDFPMGMHTPIVQAENTFSGGERQLFLLARAIAPQPRLLLLDEPTSGLDNNSQKQVMDCLNQLNITRLIITHRLTLLKYMDQVNIMENGQITQTGTYEELSQQEGLLSQLKQA